MNIVRIHSGLGNQMFQYAFFRQLQYLGQDVLMDISQFRYRKAHNGYELERLFHIRPCYATATQRHSFADTDKDTLSVVRRALGIHRKGYGQIVEEPQGDDVRFDKRFLSMDNAYLSGYWQSERYFQDVKSQLRDEFRFRCLPTDEQDMQLISQINLSESVAVHVRRGDYTKPRRAADYLTCTPRYYANAVKFMSVHAPMARFFVFSDDVEWAQHNLVFPEGTTYVEGHSGSEAWKDMYMMSHCRHHIIANSSFSWWGAWLAQTEQQIVLRPAKWFNFRQREDITPQRWIKIDNQN